MTIIPQYVLANVKRFDSRSREGIRFALNCTKNSLRVDVDGVAGYMSQNPVSTKSAGRMACILPARKLNCHSIEC